MHPAQHVQGHPLERMAFTNNGYLLWISIKVVVGSLSSGSSTESVNHGWFSL